MRLSDTRGPVPTLLSRCLPGSADVDVQRDPYCGPELALVHHRGFGFHAAACGPGVLALLEPVRARGGLVLEIGCGSGLLTRQLVRAGHRVIATDASPAMLEVARKYLGGEAPELRRIALRDDPLPEADAIVGIARLADAFGDETPPEGLRVITGIRER